MRVPGAPAKYHCMQQPQPLARRKRALECEVGVVREHLEGDCCPCCKNSRLVLMALNLEESVLMCTSKGCLYPLDADCSAVARVLHKTPKRARVPLSDAGYDPVAMAAAAAQEDWQEQDKMQKRASSEGQAQLGGAQFADTSIEVVGDGAPTVSSEDETSEGILDIPGLASCNTDSILEELEAEIKRSMATPSPPLCSTRTSVL
eukprot:COSAG05_NODE_930_length_6550_cov_17.680670_2_plen_204_part_00